MKNNLLCWLLNKQIKLHDEIPKLIMLIPILSVTYDPSDSENIVQKSSTEMQKS